MVTLCHLVHGTKINCSYFNYDGTYQCKLTDLTFDISTHELSLNIPNHIQTEKVDSITIEPKTNELQVHSIPRGIFDAFPHLYALEIRSQIDAIHSEDFKNASRLRAVELSNNRLKRLSAGTFRLVELGTLSVGANEIETIDDFAFQNQGKLTSLNLQQNKLRTIKDNTFTGLSALVTLHLSENEIELIEDYALQLPRLRNLFIRKNKLKTLNENSFASLPSLKQLKLDSNRFESINLFQFAKIPQLQRLSMGYTGPWLQNAKVETTSIKSELTELNLEGNDLTDGANLEALRVFQRLHELDLSNNKFENFDLNKDIIKQILPELQVVRFTIDDDNLDNCLRLKTSMGIQVDVECETNE